MYRRRRLSTVIARVTGLHVGGGEGRGWRLPRLSGARHRRRPLAPMMKASAAAAAIALVGATVIATLPAQAAAYGPGFDGADGHLGSYTTNGRIIYCLEPEAQRATGATDGGSLGIWTGMSADATAKLNGVISTYGQTSDPVQAAAVSLYTWSVAAPDIYNSRPYGGDAWYSPRAGSSQQAVLNKLSEIRSAAARYSAKPMPTYSATIAVDMADSYSGTVTVRNTSNAPIDGTITVGGATYWNGGTSRNATIAAGESWAAKLTGAPSDTATKYAVSAKGHFEGSAGSWFDSNIRIYNTPGAQHTAGPGTGGEHPYSFDTSTYQTDPLPLLFSPIVTTVANNGSTVKQPGVAHTDRITALVAPGSEAWRQNTAGIYLPVVARGTLYGPLSKMPNSKGVPAGTPVADRMNLTLNGPGTYTATSTKYTDKSGYFQWVWTIDSADQSARVQTMLPADYSWAALFADPDEFTSVPPAVKGVSRVDNAEVGVYQPVTDTLTTFHDPSSGTWPTDKSGQRAAVQFTATAVFLDGPEKPTAADERTRPSEPLSVQKFTTTKDSDTLTTAPVVPPARSGWVVWVWKVTSPTTAFQAWSDAFASPNEMTEVVPPTVTTTATPGVRLGEKSGDTAVVDGPKPGQPLSLFFAAYKVTDGSVPSCTVAPQPPAQPQGIPARAERAATALPVPAELYGQVPAFTNAPDEGVVVDDAGTFTSPTTALPTVGDYYWTSALVGPDGSVVASEVCDAPKELTHVFDVTTEATEAAAAGSAAHDTATVTGTVPEGTTLAFAAYLQDDAHSDNAEDSSDVGTRQASCTPAELAWQTPEAISAPRAGTYESGDHAFDAPGRYEWVVSVIDAGGDPMWTAPCGDTGEVTHVFDVTTKATAVVVAGGSAEDAATVTGSLPKGANLTWAVYRQSADAVAADAATASTASPAPTAEPTSSRDGSAAVCEASNRVWRTPSSVLAEVAGEYSSAAHTFDDPARYEWVVTVNDAKGNPIWSAPCGADGESTHVFALSTVATQRTMAFQMARDTATVEGSVPEGTTVSFQAFKQASTTAAPVCTSDNEVGTASRSVAVNGAGTFDGPDRLLLQDGRYEWIATVKDASGNVLYAAPCGDANEATVVHPVPVLAFTGSPWVIAGALVALATLLLGGLLLTLRGRARGTHRA